MVGSPRVPQSVRVGSAALAAELRDVVGPGVELVVAPTPELAAIAASLEQHARRDARERDLPEPGYTQGGRISPELVEELFIAARYLYVAAPWKHVYDHQLLRLDIPALGVHAACVSIVGNLGKAIGFLVFPDLAAFEALAKFEPPPRLKDHIDLGTTILSLQFEPAAELPRSACREVSQHGWPVASRKALPWVEYRDRDGTPRPATERQLEVVAAAAKAIATFYLKNTESFDEESGEPVSMTITDENELAVRLTIPYEAYDDFESEPSGDVLPQRPWSPRGETDASPERVRPAPASRTAPSTPVTGARAAPTAARASRKVGRNEKCPCGSGRKYKHCHWRRDEGLRVDDPGAWTAGSPATATPATAGFPTRANSPASTAIHDMDVALVEAMRQFAANRFGNAWRRYERGFTGIPHILQLSRPWSVFHCEVQGRRVVDWFLEEHAQHLTPGENAWIEAQRRSWISVWEAQEVEPGRGMLLRDLLTGEMRQVREGSGSRNLVRRDALLGRVVDHGGLSLLCGVHPRTLPPLETADFIDRMRLRLRLRRRAGGTVPLDRLRDGKIARCMIARWEDVVHEMDERRRVPPQLRNTDGEEVLFTVDTYEFEPERRSEIAAALAALGDVSTPDEANAEEGTSAAVPYAFLRSGDGRKSEPGATLLGCAWLAKDTLRIESNSKQRADALRNRIEAVGGDCLRLRGRETTDTAELFKHAQEPLERLEAPEAAEPSQAQEPPPPEIVSALLAEKRRRYAAWLDEEIPALGGRTPRRAMRQVRGRAAVDVLLRNMENREARLPEWERFDFSVLRAALKLEE